MRRAAADHRRLLRVWLCTFNPGMRVEEVVATSSSGAHAPNLPHAYTLED